MDKITIQNLEIFANHGMFQEETRLGQKFLIRAECFLDLHAAGESDNIRDSIHYGEVCHFITKYMEAHTFALIEAAAANLARELLLHWSAIKEVTVEIKKPWAPIGLPIETVSAEMTRGWHQVYLSVGANLGERRAAITHAVETLEQEEQIREVACSTLVETKAYGKTDQPDFLNGAISFRTLLEPAELLELLHRIEAGAGRERKERWGPRTLDLDILFYDDLILETPALTIPHADLHNRRFVLDPLAELCPGKVHPVLHRTVSMLRSALADKTI